MTVRITVEGVFMVIGAVAFFGTVIYVVYKAWTVYRMDG